jgi:hypothetical protein
MIFKETIVFYCENNTLAWIAVAIKQTNQQTSIIRQRLGKQVPSEMNKRATMKGLSRDGAFFWVCPRLYNEDLRRADN